MSKQLQVGDKVRVEHHFEFTVILSTESDITEEQVVVKIMDALRNDEANNVIMIFPVSNQPLSRDEYSHEGKVAIEFYEWLKRTNIIKTDIPINVKWRMFVDQKMLKK